MNWAEVRKHNRKMSARKAKRERYTAELKARIERAGGPITTEELRTSTFRVEPPAPGYCHDRFVWTFRGQDWVLGYSDGDYWQSMAPFKSWRQDADSREFIPLTPGAKKWFTKHLQEKFGSEQDQ